MIDCAHLWSYLCRTSKVQEHLFKNWLIDPWEIWMRFSITFYWSESLDLFMIMSLVERHWTLLISHNRPVSQIRAPSGGLSRTSGKLWQDYSNCYMFEHKTQYLLIRAPYTRIVVFWYISNIPPMISQSQISCNTPTFYIAATFVKYCYTTGSWLL